MLQFIRTRAPLRLGLAGGGTDLSPFCENHGGAVLNCTIDRYAYAFVSPRVDGQLVFQARDMCVDEVHQSGDILDISAGLRLHRCIYNFFLVRSAASFSSGVTVTTVVDAPPGSGLGSSSALVVALCDAFRAYTRTPLGLYELARLAFDIERIELGLAGGRQDQYAAVFGGLNFIEFFEKERAVVNPLRVEAAVLNEFEASLIVCFVGASRESAKIIVEQTENIRNDKKTISALLELKAAATEMKLALLVGDFDRMAQILGESWLIKKRTAASISNPMIEVLMEAGLAAGAKAGKVSGAGGGGFIMFMVSPEDRRRVIDGLNRAGGHASPVHLTGKGVQTWNKPSCT